VSCKVCQGTCFSPEWVAEQMRRLGEDARRYAADTEPAEDAGSSRRWMAERDYIRLSLEQLASELEGVCTACWLLSSEPAGKWLN